METVRQAYLRAKKQLEVAGIVDSAFDAACILEKHEGLARHEIFLYGDRPLQCDLSALEADIGRRASREPLQYIIGTWSFYGLDFAVGEGVLIPRPDTEILCETAIDFLKKRQAPSLLELCAGSGCVSTAVAKNVENATLCCVELSTAALPYLRKNLALHGIANRANVIEADVFQKGTAKLLSQSYPDGFDTLLCNPPYIKSADIPALEPEVATYEPMLALDGGPDGLVFYRAAENYLPLLAEGGMAAFEVGIGQSRDVAALFTSFGLRDVFIKKDYGDVERVVGGYYHRA